MKGLDTESILSKERQVMLIMEMQQHIRKMLDKSLLPPSMTLSTTVSPIPPSASARDSQRKDGVVCLL